MSVLEGERQEFEAACGKFKEEKQALVEQVQARRDLVRTVLEAAVLPAAGSPARSANLHCLLSVAILTVSTDWATLAMAKRSCTVWKG